MAEITRVSLNGRVLNENQAELTISWSTRFDPEEVESRTVFVYEIFLQNVDDDNPLDVDDRRRRLGTAWALAAAAPVNRQKTYRVDRRFLDEDFQVGIPGVWEVGDTTDEWRAEVKAKPFVAAAVSAKSDQLRMEFGWS